MKSKSAGFSLLELLVGMVIVTIGLTAAIPSYMRNMRQGEVDRYTQQLEAGFFGLRAKLGQQKTSCTLNFDTNGLNNFAPPADVVEMKEHPERMGGQPPPVPVPNGSMPRRTLIVVPPELVAQWKEQLRLYAPVLKVAVLEELAEDANKKGQVHHAIAGYQVPLRHRGQSQSRMSKLGRAQERLCDVGYSFLV